jgi:hypothetical protein
MMTIMTITIMVRELAMLTVMLLIVVTVGNSGDGNYIPFILITSRVTSVIVYLLVKEGQEGQHGQQGQQGQHDYLPC